MPIYEFRCVQCGRVFEKILMGGDDQVNMACPECSATEVERVVSVANYAMGSVNANKQPKISTKSCSPGNSCTTLELPGHSR